MSNKKQSSVEWLEQQFQIIIEKNNIELEKIWQQLKAMHKEEITSAHLCGQNSNEDIEDQQTEIEYYNETYKGGEE